jgi:hypothetical protein
LLKLAGKVRCPFRIPRKNASQWHFGATSEGDLTLRQDFRIQPHVYIVQQWRG